MTDPDLIAKKLSEIETHIRELRTIGRPDELRNDLREQRFTEHTLQIAIQSALDVASHIISDDRLGEPRTNRELFEILNRHGWIGDDLAQSLRRMAGFRNVLVHGYDTVDLDVVEDVVRNRLEDLIAFVAAVRSRIR